jgi:hypothetical protein
MEKAVSAAENTGSKQGKRGRPFSPGVSGNPQGKPAGCRNRASRMLEAITDADLAAIVAKIVQKAKAGDVMAAKILLDRLIPVPRTRSVLVDMPSLADGRAQSRATALAAVLTAMSAGQIDPSEATIIADLVERTGQAIGNCGGIGEPSPLTKEESEYANLQGGWPILKF